MYRVKSHILLVEAAKLRDRAKGILRVVETLRAAVRRAVDKKNHFEKMTKNRLKASKAKLAATNAENDKEQRILREDSHKRIRAAVGFHYKAQKAVEKAGRHKVAAALKFTGLERYLKNLALTGNINSKEARKKHHKVPAACRELAKGDHEGDQARAEIRV